MKRYLFLTLLAIASLSVSSADRVTAQTNSSVERAIQARNWGVSYGRYNPLRAGYSALAVQVISVPGGKLGPAEKFRIFVSKLKNNSSKAITAVRFDWYLFDSYDLNKLVQTAKTPLYELSLKPLAEVDADFFVTNVEDIPILRDSNPVGTFHLEVAATEVHYEDGSVWLAKDLPGSLDLSKLH